MFYLVVDLLKFYQWTYLLGILKLLLIVLLSTVPAPIFTH